MLRTLIYRCAFATILVSSSWCQATADEREIVKLVQSNGGRVKLQGDQIVGVDLSYDFKQDITDDLVIRIAGAAKNLKELRLDGSKKLKMTAKSLAHLKAYHQLESLQIGNQGSAQFLSDEALTIIGSMTNLKKLHLQGSESVTDKGIAELRHLANLEYLALSYLGKVTDRGMETVAKFAKLKEITFAGLSISDKGFSQIEACREIESFALIHPGKLPPACLTTLGALPKLKAVYLLCGAQASDKWLPAIARIGSLRRLVLSNGNFSVAGIRHLKSLSDLEELEFRHCGSIPATAAETICQLSKLKLFGLTGTTMEAAGRAKIAAKLPDCKIER